MKAYFLGKRELFDGLALAALEKDWGEYPVFHLDLNAGDYSDIEGFEAALDMNLRELEHKWGREPLDTLPPLRFMGLIRPRL